MIALLVAGAVPVSGMIGFVGLIVPQRLYKKGWTTRNAQAVRAKS